MLLCTPNVTHVINPAFSILQEMKIENIDTTLEEIQEVGEQMRVINEAISQPVGGFQDLEMDDLEAELAELEAEELDNQVSCVAGLAVRWNHYVMVKGTSMVRIGLLQGDPAAARV